MRECTNVAYAMVCMTTTTQYTTHYFAATSQIVHLSIYVAAPSLISMYEVCALSVVYYNMQHSIGVRVRIFVCIFFFWLWVSTHTHTHTHKVQSICVLCTVYTVHGYVVCAVTLHCWTMRKKNTYRPMREKILFNPSISPSDSIDFSISSLTAPHNLIFVYFFYFLLFCFSPVLFLLWCIFFFFNFWKLDWQGLEYYYCVYIFVVHAPIQYVDALHMDNGHMNVVVWAAHIWILTSIPFLQHFC